MSTMRTMAAVLAGCGREQPPYTRAALEAMVAGDAAVDITVGEVRLGLSYEVR